jgi:hypothetical protein
MLLTFNSSIQKIFVSHGRSFNYVMAQVFVLVTIHAVCSILMVLSFQSIGFVRVCRFFNTTVSALSVNLVTLLFINLAAVLREGFTKINTCLCELVQCAGQESVGLYRQISTVIHPQPLIVINNKSDRPKCRMEHITQGCKFLSDFVDLLNSVYSAHTLILVKFYFVKFIHDCYFGFAGIMDINRGVFGRAVWVRVRGVLIQLFMLLVLRCSYISAAVRLVK